MSVRYLPGAGRRLIVSRMRLLPLLAALVLSATAAAAAPDRPFYSADKLQALCESSDGDERLRCRAYIVGAADAMHGGHAICMAPATTTEDLVELVTAQLVRSDDHVGRRAETEIHKALTAAFPTPPCM